MKKIFAIVFACVAIVNAKTINLLEWEPQYKYASAEFYSFEDAKEIQKTDKHIRIGCKNGKCKLYKTPLNCPDFKTSNMDEYILTPARARRVADVCFADYETVKYKYTNGKSGIVFKRNNKKYIFEEVIEYTGENEFGKIFKIYKLSDTTNVIWQKNNSK